MKDPARWALALLAVAAVVARWGLRAVDVEGFDSVGFALALNHYDILARTPHFPGYPVYLAWAKVFHALGMPAVDALVAPNALAAGVLVVTSGMVGALLGPPRVMVACGALAACLPGLHLVGGRPLSEGLGAAWLMALLLLVLRLWSGDGRALWVGVWAGLLLGVRPAWVAAPVGLFLPFLVARRRQGLELVAGAALGCVVWLGLLVLLTPLDGLFTAAQRVLVGHFTVWGGTAVTDDDSTSRAARLAWGLWVWGLGGTTSSADGVARQLASLVLLGACGGLLYVKRVPRPLAGALVVTALYVLVGANPDNPRHMAQVLVVLIPFLGLALAQARLLAVPLCAVVALAALPVATEQATQPSAAIQVGQFLAHIHNAHFFGFTTVRSVEWVEAATHTQLVESLPEACTRLTEKPVDGPVFFESRLKEKRRRDFDFEPVATFTRDVRVDPAGAAITLYRLKTPCARVTAPGG